MFWYLDQASFLEAEITASRLVVPSFSPVAGADFSFAVEQAEPRAVRVEARAWLPGEARPFGVAAGPAWFPADAAALAVAAAAELVVADEIAAEPAAGAAAAEPAVADGAAEIVADALAAGPLADAAAGMPVAASEEALVAGEPAVEAAVAELVAEAPFSWRAAQPVDSRAADCDSEVRLVRAQRCAQQRVDYDWAAEWEPEQALAARRGVRWAADCDWAEHSAVLR